MVSPVIVYSIVGLSGMISCSVLLSRSGLLHRETLRQGFLNHDTLWNGLSGMVFSLVGLSDLVVSIVGLSGKGSPSRPCPLQEALA